MPSLVNFIPLHLLKRMLDSSANFNEETSSSISTDQKCILIALLSFTTGFMCYAIYVGTMDTVSELLRRLLVISPLLLVILHWLSTGTRLGLPILGSNPDSIHQADGSSWGVAILLVLLLFLIIYQPSFT